MAVGGFRLAVEGVCAKAGIGGVSVCRALYVSLQRRSGLGHSRRFVRVRATSGYPPKLTVKANRQALSPGAAALRPRTKFQIREETLSEGMRSRGRATTSDRFPCTPDRCHLSATPKSSGVGPILLQKSFGSGRRIGFRHADADVCEDAHSKALVALGHRIAAALLVLTVICMAAAWYV
jgi:hypothetical protein